MKIELNDDTVIIYLYNNKVDINNIDEINKLVKDIFIKLIKRYQLDYFGLSKVTIYHNKNYGLVMEIVKIYSSEYYHKTIDLKLTIYKDTLMYLEFDDYLFSSKPKNLIIKNNKYYLNIDSISNINKYIEYGRLIFKKN